MQPGKHEDVEHHGLHLAALDLLAQYSGVRPTIRPAMNTRAERRSGCHIAPRPTPPNTTSPSFRLTRGTRPPSGLKLSCMELTAPHRCARGRGSKEGGVDHPEAHLLALQVADALVERQAGQGRIWAGLGSVGGENPGQEQDGHRPEYRPSLPLFARHAAKGVGPARRGCRESAGFPGNWSPRWDFRTGARCFALKKPPPLVPSSLITSCEPVGPMGMNLPRPLPSR